jgi:transposase-like protein
MTLRAALPRFVENALLLSERREFLGRNMPACPSCTTKQVQLIDGVNKPAEWKCRHCKTKFTHEPEAT